jgi:hypothetical protein
MITSDKPEYKVGETATFRLPESAQGRALLSLENGSLRCSRYRWIEAQSGKTIFQGQGRCESHFDPDHHGHGA